jgi:hypothetical protein
MMRFALTGLLSAALVLPVLAEDPDEEFPEGPAGTEEEAMPESDEEEMEEEEVDVVGTLEGIIGKMKDAEESLAGAGSWKATDAQGNAIEDVNKLIQAQDLQKKAIEEMTRIFDGGKKKQQGAVEDIEKLIKLAKECQGSCSGDKKQQASQKKQQQPKNQQTQKPSNPATQPYQPTGDNSDRPLEARAAELSDRWGNLPDKLRDELSQADDDFRNSKGEYGHRLKEYSKVMSFSE